MKRSDFLHMRNCGKTEVLDQTNVDYTDGTVYDTKMNLTWADTDSGIGSGQWRIGIKSLCPVQSGHSEPAV